jgi:hypothetical protein
MSSHKIVPSAANPAPNPNPNSGGGSHQNRPFSPYRHAPTNEDLLHAALMNGMASLNMNGIGQPPSSVKASSSVKAPSSRRSQASRMGSKVSTNPKVYDSDVTPTPSRPQSPQNDQLTVQEERIVREALTPYTRSTVSASGLGMDVANSHFHDMDLCILLHQTQNKDAHEVVKRALRKAIKQRIKKLGMKYDSEVGLRLFKFSRAPLIKRELYPSSSQSKTTASRSIITTQAYIFKAIISLPSHKRQRKLPPGQES